MNYFKVLLFLQSGNKGPFDIPVEEQRLFLESLGEPKDDIDRGYKQFLCQNYFVPRWKRLLFNIVAAFLLPAAVIFFLIKRCFVRRGEQIDTMMERKGMDEIIPIIVKQKYKPNDKYWNKGSSISLNDLQFISKLVFCAPHQPYFVLKAFMNLVHYSDMMFRHTPKVMIQFGEFSFSSSILSAYCHRHGVKHINIMHGEKLWFIRDAFFHYDECYVWDEFYANLFIDLKAEANQFVVQLPESMHIDTQKYVNENVFSNYKYYLADITKETIASIIASMEFAIKERKTVKYRPHPRYTDMNILTKYVDTNNIEFPSDVGILESISNLDYAVGSYTTVLSQAFFSGKKVVLDDVTYKDQFNKLKDMNYILAAKELETLSNLNKMQ